MRKVFLIYDNHVSPNLFIKKIIGEKNFGQIILRRQSIHDKFFSEISNLQFIKGTEEINHVYEWEFIRRRIQIYPPDAAVIHIFSQSVIKNLDEVRLILEKACYIQKPVLVISEKLPALFAVPSVHQYLKFMEYGFLHMEDMEIYNNSSLHFDRMETTAFFNISIYTNFQKYISGGFDARFFNSIGGDEYTVTKTSKDKRKIHAEYSFYHLLPDKMKMWFVMPFDYREEEDSASYTMERYHMTDLAIRWVHQAISIQEFEQLLQRVFHFIAGRAQKSVSPEEYQETADQLYLHKISERIDKLKNEKKYNQLALLLQSGTTYTEIDDLMESYNVLYKRIASSPIPKPFSVIGHGDLCFSNMLFNSETNMLKFIDPKGAETENQLWTDPYYDIAKLSHSICGRYDFFNNALFQIVLGENLQFQLEIDFDNSKYIELFRIYCEQNGFDFLRIRLYEVSLFLSMLPLHIDNPQKVYGFILNGINLLKEVEKCIVI